MVAAILRRLTLSALALLGAGLVIFVATEALPGDAATAVLGREAIGETLQAMRHEMGLDQPLGVRFLGWMAHIIRGDLGVTLTTRQPAWEIIEPALMNSMALGSLAVVFTVPIAVLLGTATGVRRGTVFDNVVSGLSLATLSLPEFVIGVLLAVLFGILWPLFPATSLLLPCLVLHRAEADPGPATARLGAIILQALRDAMPEYCSVPNDAANAAALVEAG